MHLDRSHALEMVYGHSLENEYVKYIDLSLSTIWSSIIYFNAQRVYAYFCVMSMEIMNALIVYKNQLTINRL